MGDAILLVSAWLLGPLYGTVAAGIGSMLADLFSGYVIYAPATIIIKSLVALIAILLYKSLSRVGKSGLMGYVISAIVAELFMVLGYFLYELWLYGPGAVAAIPANCVQGIFATVAGVLITRLLIKNKTIKEFI